MTTRRITSSSITSGGGGATVRYQPDQPVGITPGELWVDSDGDTDVVDAETFLTKESASASYVYKTGDTITGPTVITANSSSDILRITQTGSGNALVVEDSTNPDSTPFVIDNNGKLITGNNSSIAGVGGVQGGIQLHNSSPGVTLSIGNWSTGGNDPSRLEFMKSRSGSVGTNSLVSQNDDIGAIRFSADDGSSFIEAVKIFAEVDGTPGPDDMPGRLIFSTTPDGSNSPVEAMRIDSSGKVQIGGTTTTDASLYVEHNANRVVFIKQTDTSLSNDTYTLDVDSAAHVSNVSAAGAFRVKTSSGDSLRVIGAGPVIIGDNARPTGSVHGDLAVSGSIFIGGTAAANELDDYEEGTFTPTYVGATTDFTSITYDSVTSGFYTKIGRVVYFSLTLRTDAITVGSAAGALRISGLPFTALSDSGNADSFSVSVGYAATFAGEEPISALVLAGTTRIQLYYRTAVDGDTSSVAVADAGTGVNANEIFVSGFYFTA